jgi:hypothetical protein
LGRPSPAEVFESSFTIDPQRKEYLLSNLKSGYRNELRAVSE